VGCHDNQRDSEKYKEQTIPIHQTTPKRAKKSPRKSSIGSKLRRLFIVSLLGDMRIARSRAPGPTLLPLFGTTRTD